MMLGMVILLLSGCLSPAQSVDVPTSLPTESLLEAAPATEVPVEEVEEAATPTLLPSPEPTAPPPTPEPVPPPGIILMIGDGMGAGHRQAATWLAYGMDGILVMDSLPVHGLAATNSANAEVTDSAAAATAMATGQLTKNYYLGVDPDGEPLETILEMAEGRGWATGLITTVPLAHATPAAFAVHYPERQDFPLIARLMSEQPIEVLMGGGEDDFRTVLDGGCFPGAGYQAEGNDLTGAAIEDGYRVICGRNALLSLPMDPPSPVLGLFAAEEMSAPYSPSLSEMVETALAILSQDPDGFFLMVEAGQIDWAAHENQADEVMQDTIGLDAAVTTAMIFTLDHPDTLLVVAADHDTGGLSVNLDGSGSFLQDGPYQMPDGTSFWVDWSSGNHTAAPIPVTASGPFSEMLAGEYHLTRIFETMAAFMDDPR